MYWRSEKVGNMNDFPYPVNRRKRTMPVATGPCLYDYFDDSWIWDIKEKSRDCLVYGNLKVARFHPNWSNGTAGVRGTKVLNKGRFYWEIHVTQRIFGTSMMFGIGTKKARLHLDAFVNLLGEDRNGYGLSHKGLLWHDGQFKQYTKPFQENVPTTVGLLFDGIKGTLSYYKDGKSLGVAFTDLHLVEEDLFPIVCSTAAKTEMSLGIMKKEFRNLQDRCRTTVLKQLLKENDIDKLPIPNAVKRYLRETLEYMTVKYPKAVRTPDDNFCITFPQEPMQEQQQQQQQAPATQSSTIRNFLKLLNFRTKQSLLVK